MIYGTLIKKMILWYRLQRYFYDTDLKYYFTIQILSNSTSILHPIRPQFYVQFDLNYTSNSISIIPPIRPQLYVQFDLNYTTVPCNNFFLPTVRSWGDMELPLATICVLCCLVFLYLLFNVNFKNKINKKNNYPSKAP